MKTRKHIGNIATFRAGKFVDMHKPLIRSEPIICIRALSGLSCVYV